MEVEEIQLSNKNANVYYAHFPRHTCTLCNFKAVC